MKKILLFTFLLLLSLTVIGQHKTLKDVVSEHQLENGMRFLLVQRDGAPMISAGWVAHVGSANERPGITGISHLFEHMMFKGSSTIGVEDAKLDDQLRAELDSLRSQMFELERDSRLKVRTGVAESMSDSSLQSEEMKALETKFQAVIEQQRENLIKDQFDQIYTEQGATGMNAFTNTDMTVYFIRVPKNKLELWFWMESERLSDPVFREFYSERDVVYEERRMRTESTPTGKQNEVYESMYWRGHPYGWPVVGWPSDISAITREQAEDFFDIYYAPNNLTAVLVGDFDQAHALKLANDYFGRIPRGEKAPPEVVTLFMPLEGGFEYKAEVDAPPSAALTFHTTAYAGVDHPALMVLADVLNGKTGRLHKRMVLKDQIATSASAAADSRKYAGVFEVMATGKAGVDPQQLKATLLEEVGKIQTDGISEYELEKVRNNLTANNLRRLEDNFFLGIQLLYYDGLRDWSHMETLMDRVALVSREDVQRVAEKYLQASDMGSKIYTRKTGGEQLDPALAEFSEEQIQMLNQLQSQLASASPEKKKEMLTQLPSMGEAAPPEVKAVIDYLLQQQGK
ncbi:MAG: insulinase family protein [Xanthomonadales bacterium]|nr:insulinase family protein [Xanthomonadales bacterium]